MSLGFLGCCCFYWSVIELKQPHSLLCVYGLHLQSVISMHQNAVRVWQTYVWIISSAVVDHRHVDDQAVIWLVLCSPESCPLSRCSKRPLKFNAHKLQLFSNQDLLRADSSFQFHLHPFVRPFETCFMRGLFFNHNSVFKTSKLCQALISQQLQFLLKYDIFCLFTVTLTVNSSYNLHFNSSK